MNLAGIMPDPGLGPNVMKTSFAIALGSNRRHGRHGSPQRVVAAALHAIEQAGIGITARSRIRATPALGPAGRAFANAAAIIETDLAPGALLARLKRIERDFGRRRGRRWGARVLDLDIILWSQGPYADRTLIVPHPEFRKRGFVLDPVAEIAGNARDPISGATVRQLRYRLMKQSPVDRGARRS